MNWFLFPFLTESMLFIPAVFVVYTDFSAVSYIALDITSISSYSQLMKSCEWGYNRDHENLPQINLCMLFGEESMLPVYQTAYTGSLKDVTTL